MSLMRIDELFHFEKGSLQSSKCTEGEFNFITASSEWKTHNEYTHDCEALVFAAAASGSLGRTHYVNGKFISSDLCFIITPKDPINLPIDLKFYHMIFNEFKNDIVKNTKAGTSKEAIGMKAFGNYKLPYFDIEKQVETKIQFVNMQHSKIELTSELNHQLGLIKQLRQAFLREAMQGKLVKSTNTKETGQQLLEKIKAEKAQLIAEKKLKKEKELPLISEDEIPFEIPEHWAWCRIAEITTKIGSGSTPKGSNYSENGKPFFRSQNVYDNGLVYDDIKFVSDEVQKQMNGTVVLANDVLLNITGGSMGRCALVPNDFEEGNVSQHVCIIRSILINNIFLHKLILSPYFQKLIFSSTSGAGREGLPKYNLEQFIIPLPPLHEQEQIVAKLEELMAFCDGLEQSIKESQGYNEQLLQQVLREALQGEKNKYNIII
ncbi:restriction endonuclease subunit S [Flavobacterium macrobrachii]|uniref:restriction endonuclease subunit S n=1 Tax=Flavobacterium macrobrachii TaxID=591204 RepID=UPI003F6E73AC